MVFKVCFRHQKFDKKGGSCGDRSGIEKTWTADLLELLVAQGREQEALKKELEAAAAKRCGELEMSARQKADAYWQEVSSRLQSFYQEHEALKELLAQGGHP